MGPKRKKKQVTNPARGFATTSIASKTKLEQVADVIDDLEASNAATSAVEKSTTPSTGGVDNKELSQLSPDELEKRLEENEIHSVAEKYAQKVGRDSDRQLSRLRADRRVLRSQSVSLSPQEWFKEDVSAQIWDLVRRELFSEVTKGSSTLDQPSTDSLVPKLWTLQRVLCGLGFTKQKVHGVFEWLCSHPPPMSAESPLWGFNECLEVLAVEDESDDIFLFDKAMQKPSDTRSISSQLETSSTHTLNNSPRFKDNLQNPQQQQNFITPDSTAAIPQEGHSDDSGLDSDLEPEQLVSKYVSIKSRIFDLDPGAFQQTSKKNRGSSSNRISSPKIVKLEAQLTKIERDVLFEADTAEKLWEQQRFRLIKERAARKTLELDDAKEPRSVPIPPAEKGAQETTNNASKDSDTAETPDLVDYDMLGGIFMEGSVEENTTLSVPDTYMSVTIRDFGEPKGVRPQRILNELLRARDSEARQSFKLVSPTTYSSRHSITISWSKEQDTSQVLLIPGVSYGWQSACQLVMTMVSISTPSEEQSEAYIATAALFLLCSTSWNDEKSYLRLPPAWRDLYREFLDVKKEQDLVEARQDVRELRLMLEKQREKEQAEGVVLISGFRGRPTPNDFVKDAGATRSGSSIESSPSRLQAIWEAKVSAPTYRRMLHSRSSLPIFEFRDSVLAAIDANQVTILCAETGAGKSTQLPAYILEHELSRGRVCKILCTEPRRISAISLAQRVSEELGEPRNALGTPSSLVGYAIRLESNYVAETRIIYATVGIVLRMMESAAGLEDVTHLLIDEVHERSIDTDFLLIILRNLISQKSSLKVVLMSATIDARRLSAYLGDAPIMNVPGRTFHVQTHYLEDAIEFIGYGQDSSSKEEDESGRDDEESDTDSKSGLDRTLRSYSAATRTLLATYDEYRVDYSLIIKLIARVASDPAYEVYSKAFLVFLPGIAEIRHLNDLILSSEMFDERWMVHPLHSTIATEEQQRAFMVPPIGIRKIVLATNIAETGVTIPDITCVIDTGKHREMRFDERRQLSRLIQAFISRANAKQRRGRAGRVQEGLCFHLFTRFRHDELMMDHQTPEMLRLSLQDLAMRTKICKLGDIEKTLSEALDPPTSKNIRRAIDALVEVDALTEAEELTPLGIQLAKLPLDARLGKFVLLSAIFGCVDVAITIAAILSSKSPFAVPFGAKQRADAARLAFATSDSDLLTEYNAYKTWRAVCTNPGLSEGEFCRKNLLSAQSLSSIEDLKAQLLISLVDTGLVTLSVDERKELNRCRSSRRRAFVKVPSPGNVHDENALLVNSLVAAAFYPHILTREGKGWRNISNNQRINLPFTSVNRGTKTANLLSYHSIMQGGNKLLTANYTSMVHALPLLILAGNAAFHLYAGVIIMDGNRLRFSTKDGRTLLMLKKLRFKVKEIIDFRLKKPSMELDTRQRKWMELFLGLLQTTATS